jgi:O-antigen biosynthesis protein WbqP
VRLYARYLKRLIDVAAALVGILALSPMFALVSVAIRLGSPGPALFRQVRVGQHGEPFTILKFRSMRVGAPSVPSAASSEAQITAVGRWIRRTNVDELPQLFNILRGDMSIVGPRPAVESQSHLIALRRESGALSVRPGLTGLAQVNAFDGMSDETKAGFDAEYAREVTCARDIAILAKTLAYLRKPPPKY